MPIDPDMVAAISQCLAERAGLELPAWIVDARAASRSAALGVGPAEYLALITSAHGATELDALIEAVRVGESRLFRHRSQIAALANHVVPTLQGKRSIRVWSAGCSTGEEPYTLAAVLKASLPNASISIVATDVSSSALAVARAARYPARALADVPEEWRNAFIVEGSVLRVRPDVAALVKFERANLVDSSNVRGCDLVWCRNVLIYFTDTARERVIDRLVAATAPGGCIFVGYSETLRDVKELEAARAGEAVFYVRAGDGASQRTLASGAGGRTTTTPAPQRRTPAIERVELTPPPTRIPLLPPSQDVYALGTRPTARELTAELTARLAIVGLSELVIDLDPAELLADELAPVLRRAGAAARAAHVKLVLRTTRAGTRRWIARHALDEDEP